MHSTNLFRNRGEMVSGMKARRRWRWREKRGDEFVPTRLPTVYIRARGRRLNEAEYRGQEPYMDPVQLGRREEAKTLFPRELWAQNPSEARTLQSTRVSI